MHPLHKQCCNPPNGKIYIYICKRPAALKPRSCLTQRPHSLHHSLPRGAHTPSSCPSPPLSHLPTSSSRACATRHCSAPGCAPSRRPCTYAFSPRPYPSSLTWSSRPSPPLHLPPPPLPRASLSASIATSAETRSASSSGSLQTTQRALPSPSRTCRKCSHPHGSCWRETDCLPRLQHSDCSGGSLRLTAWPRAPRSAGRLGTQHGPASLPHHSPDSYTLTDSNLQA